MLPINDGKVLKLSWLPPSGYWENYNILLRNGSEVLVNQSTGKESTQLAFSSLGFGLVPGRLYGADVTVQSGSLANTARCYGRLGQLASTSYCTKQVEKKKPNHTHVLFDIPAPGPVQQLLVSHADESSLGVLWNQPAGEWDGYSVVLRQGKAASVVDRRLLSREARQCTFYGLTSGCLYSITVATNSGNLSSSSTVTTRTSQLYRIYRKYTWDILFKRLCGCSLWVLDSLELNMN